jgi:hypothetical protein
LIKHRETADTVTQYQLGNLAQGALWSDGRHTPAT